MKKSKTLKTSKKMILAFCSISVLVTISYAKPRGGDREPPQEAIEVCEGQETGSECSMNTPRGILNGTCITTPDDKYFVCMPEGRRKGR